MNARNKTTRRAAPKRVPAGRSSGRQAAGREETIRAISTIITNMKLPDLKMQLAALNAEIEAAHAAEVDTAIATCKEIISLYGLTAFDLGFVRTQQIRANRGSKTFRAKAPAASPPPRYRNPETGATWSGRGRTPHWINGQDRDAFLVV